MVFGEHIKEVDVELNPIKEKKLNNIRTVLTDESIKLIPPRLFTLEEAIAYVRGIYIIFILYLYYIYIYIIFIFIFIFKYIFF